MICDATCWCDEFSWYESHGRKLLVVGDDFSGNLFALDTEHNYRVVLLVPETMKRLPFKILPFKGESWEGLPFKAGGIQEVNPGADAARGGRHGPEGTMVSKH